MIVSDEFVERLRIGDAEAVGQLRDAVRAGLTRLYAGYGFDNDEAQSLADWTIAVALHEIATFKFRARLNTWVFGIAKCLARDMLRQKLCSAHPRDALDDPQLESLDDSTVNSRTLLFNEHPIAEAGAANRTRRHVLARRAWLALTKRDRRVLLQTRYWGLTHAEIACRENVSVNAIGVRNCRARRRLEAAYNRLAVNDQTTC